MKHHEFVDLLKTHRAAACHMLATQKVAEWMNDGVLEVVRVIGRWMESGLNLSDDELLVELAYGCELIEEEEHAFP